MAQLVRALVGIVHGKVLVKVNRVEDGDTLLLSAPCCHHTLSVWAHMFDSEIWFSWGNKSRDI